MVLVELLFPGAYLDAVEDLKSDKLVDVLPCPDEHLVSICLVKSSLPAGDVLSSTDSSFRELTRLICGNGCTLSVLYRTLPETAEYRTVFRAMVWRCV